MRRSQEIGVALLLVGFSHQAGAQSFNRRYDPAYTNGGGSTAWSVEVMDDGNYAVVGNGAYTYNGSLFYSSIVRSLVIDLNGELLSESVAFDTVHATYPGWSNGTHKRMDGGFVVGGSNFRTDSLDNWIQRPVLYFFDAQGNYEQHIPLGPDNQSWIGRQAKQTPDGGFVICGETSAVGNALQAFVIKTDAQGNEEWTQTYGGQWNDYTMSIEPRASGGYFMGGQYRVSSGNPQMWFAMLNDTGVVIWEQIWGGQYEDLSVHAVELADGHLLLAGGRGYGGNGPYRRYLAKLDSSDGSFIWQKEYSGTEPDCLFRVAQEISPFGDLIAVGQGRLNATNCGTLLRTTSSGDSLWMRNYQYSDSLVNSGRGAFRDGIPTPDGGFIAVGTALQAGPYTQDVWVVKVDSMGCLEPGCHLITGMETQITNLRGALKVWPNPVAHGGSVQVLLDLPENFAVQGALRITVTDAMGRVVHEEVIAEAGHSELRGTKQEGVPASLTATQLPSGLYHIHLSDASRWIAGAKLVVE